MALQDKRFEIVQKYVPKLIEILTNFDSEDENFKLCEQFVFYTIKNHRNLSVNSHAVRKRIEGMEEKFHVANLSKYADYLKKLCDKLTNHSLCIDHYEFDVQWSILDFLFSLSINPVNALEQNKHNIDIETESTEIIEKTYNKNDYWVNLLKSDFVESDDDDYDSNLSEWTDSGDEVIEKELPVVKPARKKSLSPKRCVSLIPGANLQSPRKEKNFKLFASSTDDSKTWLQSNCQNKWWAAKDSNCIVDSTFDIANYAILWNKFISDKSNNLIKYESITTESEYCLLREILWMFMLPKNYKFFSMNEEDISIRHNVTIPSVTVHGLKLFLQSNFVPYIKQQHTLTNFINSIYQYKNKTPPRTYECYAACLKELLQPFYSRVLFFEDIVKSQKPATICSIIQLKKDMDHDLNYLHTIHTIHENVILDYEKYPSHIVSAYLLSSLIQNFHLSNTKDMANLSITIFLSCLPVFFNIIDTLWTVGNLEDSENEFLIEKMSVDEVSLRPYEKTKELSFFVPANVSKIILNDSFLNILIQHSLEAGGTLNLLNKIDKISNLRRTIEFEENLYEAFINDVLSSISQFSTKSEPETETVMSTSDSYPNSFQSVKSSKSKYDTLLNECQSKDHFLALAFSSSVNLYDVSSDEDETIEVSSLKDDHNAVEHECKPLSLLEKISEASKITLPLEEIIIQSIGNILKHRVTVANKFVTNMYLNDFKILKHLQNIRRVLLLESSDLLGPFYIKIFSDIENGKKWANSLALSIQLDDIMSSKFSDISSLFRVEVKPTFKCDSIRVVDAVDDLSIYYNLKNEIQNVITEESVEAYNKIFHFLLKIKWALWALESLKFPKNHRNRIPYAELTLLDLEMRRLEQLRFWMMFSIQCLHFHLMTYVLHSMNQKLDKKIENCLKLSEMKSVHTSYINTISEHCFIINDSSDIKISIEQIINLIFVLRVEWNSCLTEIENELENVSAESLGDESNLSYNRISQIESVEKTYIKCHQFLAKALNNEVYVNQNTFLTGLSAAFNTSIPY